MIHQFSPQVAKEFGIPAAIIHQYFRHVTDQNFERLGVRSTKTSIREMEKLYGGHLKRDAIHRAVHALIYGGRRRPGPVQCLIQEGFSSEYSMQPPGEDEFKGEAPHYFDSEIAARLGHVPAIILHNVAYWVRSNWKASATEALEGYDVADYHGDASRMCLEAFLRAEGAACHYVTPRRWQEVHSYIPLRTVERAFTRLEQEGLLVKMEGHDRKTIWTLPHHRLVEILAKACLDAGSVVFRCLDYLREKEVFYGLTAKTGQFATKPDTSAKTRQSPPKPDTHRQNRTSHRQNRTLETLKEAGIKGPNDVFRAVNSNVVETMLVEAFIVEAYFQTSLREALDKFAAQMVLAGKLKAAEESYRKTSEKLKPVERVVTVASSDAREENDLHREVLERYVKLHPGSTAAKQRLESLRR